MQVARNAHLTEQVIAAAIAVHKGLGPGLLESIYQRAMQLELRLAGLPVQSQVELPVTYRTHLLGIGLRLDLLIDTRLVVEIKSVARLDELHLKQLITYLRVSRLQTGLLINFNAKRLIDGVRRVSL